MGTLRCTALGVALIAGEGTTGLSCATGEMVCGPERLSVVRQRIVQNGSTCQNLIYVYVRKNGHLSPVSTTRWMLLGVLGGGHCRFVGLDKNSCSNAACQELCVQW